MEAPACRNVTDWISAGAHGAVVAPDSRARPNLITPGQGGENPSSPPGFRFEEEVRYADSVGPVPD